MVILSIQYEESTEAEETGDTLCIHVLLHTTNVLKDSILITLGPGYLLDQETSFRARCSWWRTWANTWEERSEHIMDAYDRGNNNSNH